MPDRVMVRGQKSEEELWDIDCANLVVVIMMLSTIASTPAYAACEILGFTPAGPALPSEPGSDYHSVFIAGCINKYTARRQLPGKVYKVNVNGAGVKPVGHNVCAVDLCGGVIGGCFSGYAQSVHICAAALGAYLHGRNVGFYATVYADKEPTAESLSGKAGGLELFIILKD